MIDWLRQVAPDEIKAYYWAAQGVYTSPVFYAGVLGILILERIRPAMREQRLLSRGFVADFGWFHLDLVFKAGALPAFVGLLAWLYDETTGSFRIQTLAAGPLALRVTLSLLIYDFLQWLQHWIRHKVPVLWHFHVIHHSQRELNLFTDLRVHFVEYFVSRGVEFIPMLLLGLQPFEVLWVATVMSWHTRLAHANVRTNYGPLGHLLVSPQYHRVHHSIDPEHVDRNFGAILTVWDRLFGTYHHDRHVYPPTGVAEVEFTVPEGASPRVWTAYFVRQVRWPFAQLADRGNWQRPRVNALGMSSEVVQHDNPTA